MHLHKRKKAPIVERVDLKLVRKISELTKGLKRLPNSLGTLNIIDSTDLVLPKNLCDCAYVSQKHTYVKMHTRLVVASPDIAYPEQDSPINGTGVILKVQM